MKAQQRGPWTECLPHWARSAAGLRGKSIHLSILKYTLAFYGSVSSYRGPKTQKAWTSHTLPVGSVVYSQKLLFSLRCPLEWFGLYQSLVCRIYLAMYPWAPCRSKHHPREQWVQRWLERMEMGKRENSAHLSERTASCLSFQGNGQFLFKILGVN